MEWWVTAIILTLSGTTLSAVGLMLQKHSHNQKRSEKESAGRFCLYFLSRQWIFGLCVFIFGHVVCWMGLALGTQVVLSCLNVWSMVVTFVLAPMILRETVSVCKIASVLVIISGVVLVIIFGPRNYRPYTVQLFVDSLDNTIFIYTTVAAILLLACLALKAATAPIDAAHNRLSCAEFTLVSAVIGWYSVLSAKCSAGLIWTSWHLGESQIDIWITWVVIVVMIGCAIGNVHFMNMGMKTGEAVFVVPFYESLSILGQVFLGGIFFDEFKELDITGHHPGFWVGVLLVIAGIACMTGKPPTSEILNRPVLAPGYMQPYLDSAENITEQLLSPHWQPKSSEAKEYSTFPAA
mmetsp:Transcript_108196/g.304845  ORF Transcript_108196/g.304845 Transcript_108196/m.304845 type:complete len:351 (-) Transcript_108196:87-1139(-)